MRTLNMMLLMLAGYTMGTHPIYGQLQPYGNPDYDSIESSPSQPYVSTSPGEFVVIPDRHVFYNSRLPVVVDEKLRVFIRSYDPQRGVYIDTEVPDPTCVMVCRRRQAQAEP